MKERSTLILLLVLLFTATSTSLAQPASRWVDAGVTTQGATFLFQGSSYLRFHNAQLDPGYPRLLAGGGWQGLPTEFQAGIDAAVYAADRDKTYFFKGNQYVRLTGVVVDPGYPLPLPGGWEGLPAEFQSGIDAALYFAGHIFFFKGGRYARFTGSQLDFGYPADLPGGWELPSGFKVDAAVAVGDKNYFFAGSDYVRLTGTQMDPGYPLPLPGGWAGLPPPGAVGSVVNPPAAPLVSGESASTEYLQPWTTQDIIDPRIDVSAQYAMMRMCTGSLDEVRDMSSMLFGVKNGSLAGIYIQDQQVPALRARDELGKGWWELLPAGVDASCLTEPASEPPIIVLRKATVQDKDRFDSALRDAWNSCGLPESEPRACVQTLPPQQPREVRACAEAVGYPTLSVRVLSGLEPVAGAQVTVSGGDANEIQADITGGPGLVGFTLNGPGLFTVEASMPGYPPSLNNAVSASGNCSYSRTVWLGERTNTAPGCTPEKYFRLKALCVKLTKDNLRRCVQSYHSQLDGMCEEALPCLAAWALGPQGPIGCILGKVADGTCAVSGQASVFLTLVAQIKDCYVPYREELANCDAQALKHCQ